MTVEGAEQLTVTVRPLVLGMPIGHPSGSAGTLGPFVVLASGCHGFLSAANVLAPRGAKRGDFIHQPGPFDGLPTGETRIASLVKTDAGDETSLNPDQIPGIAVAELLGGVEFEGNRLPAESPGGGSFLTRPIGQDDLAPGDEVAVIGRSGIHLGIVEAISISGLTVETEQGAKVAPVLFAVKGKDGPFSRPGDAGAVVYRMRDCAAFGLLFAADGASATATAYCLPLASALERLGARILVAEDLASEAAQEMLAL